MGNGDRCRRHPPAVTAVAQPATVLITQPDATLIQPASLPHGIVYLLHIQYGINVFLRISSAAWYRLAKYIMTQE